MVCVCVVLKYEYVRGCNACNANCRLEKHFYTLVLLVRDRMGWCGAGEGEGEEWKRSENRV